MDILCHRLPPTQTWVYVCLQGGCKVIAKRKWFSNNWKYTSGITSSINDWDSWMDVKKAPLSWRKDAVLMVNMKEYQ